MRRRESAQKGLKTTSGAKFAALPLVKPWSSQLFDLRAPSSTDVPVLLLNQPIIISRLSMMVEVRVVLNRTVADSDQ